MQAWRFKTGVGGLEKNLKLETVEKPAEPSAGSEWVLVEVIGSSLNPADYKLPEVWPRLSPWIFPRPAAPGLDFSGRVVDTTGSLQDSKSKRPDLKHGQLVYGRLGLPQVLGTLSQYILAPLDGVVPLPKNIKPVDGAALGTAAITAYQSLAPYVKKGSKVFVNGGSGGVGTFTVQIAKLLGCHVTASCSGTNEAFVKELGADEVIDYRSKDLVQELSAKGQVFDVLVDNVGATRQLHSPSVSFLKPGGQYVQVVGQDKTWSDLLNMVGSLYRPAFLGGINRKYKVMLVVNNLDHLKQIDEWVADGKLKITIDSKFPWEEAPKAFERLKTGRSRGKVLVEVLKEND